MKKRKLILMSLFFFIASLVVFIQVLRLKKYDVTHPKRGTVIEAVYGLGRVKSFKTYDLVVGVVLQVKKVHVSEGDLVSKGDPLITFDSSTTRAPFSGVVTSIKIYEGETAIPMVPLLRVENLKRRFIEVSLEQQSALKVKKGQKVRISFESLGRLKLEGEVQVIFPRDDEFIAHIKTKKLADNILSGMTADISIEIGRISNSLMIPIRTISNGMITVKRNGRWVKEKVEIGHVDGLYAEVRNPRLTEDDEIRFKRR